MEERLKRNLRKIGHWSLIGGIVAGATWTTGYLDRNKLKENGIKYIKIMEEGYTIEKYAMEIKKCPSIRRNIDPRDIVSVIMEINEKHGNKIEDSSREFKGKLIILLNYDNCP